MWGIRKSSTLLSAEGLHSRGIALEKAKNLRRNLREVETSIRENDMDNRYEKPKFCFYFFQTPPVPSDRGSPSRGFPETGQVWACFI